jgi:acyl carrier protein
VEAASPATVTEWDSVATVTLLALVEEEFSVAIDVDDFGNEISFTRILAMVETTNIER